MVTTSGNWAELNFLQHLSNLSRFGILIYDRKFSATSVEFGILIDDRHTARSELNFWKLHRHLLTIAVRGDSNVDFAKLDRDSLHNYVALLDIPLLYSNGKVTIFSFYWLYCLDMSM
jgi:hypothetical protein